MLERVPKTKSEPSCEIVPQDMSESCERRVPLYMSVVA